MKNMGKLNLSQVNDLQLQPVEDSYFSDCIIEQEFQKRINVYRQRTADDDISYIDLVETKLELRESLDSGYTWFIGPIVSITKMLSGKNNKK